ncbi:MAG TPA: hypothetical protein ENJ82_03250, partial [Bacteroidetes bacterium]|nr:hypothetical protein [Bacteroidota bacterium]
MLGRNRLGLAILLGVIFWIGAGMTKPNTGQEQVYRFPMNGSSFLLSGTFGELRGNHFHSGIDIKTGG